MAIDAIGARSTGCWSAGAACSNGRTAAAAQAAATTDLAALISEALGCAARRGAAVVGMLIGDPHRLSGDWQRCSAWPGRLAPVWTWWVSRPRPRRRVDALSLDDRSLLHDVARDTWRLFERCVGAEDRHLPPDNLQTTPQRHGGAPDLADQHRPVPARNGLRAPLRLDRRHRDDRAHRGDAGDAGRHDAPSRPLSQLVRHPQRRAAQPALRLDRRQRQPVHAAAGGRAGLPGGEPRRRSATPRCCARWRRRRCASPVCARPAPPRAAARRWPSCSRCAIRWRA